MPEDEKKQIEPLLIDEKQYKVSDIVLTKINTLLNYQLLNGAVAWQIRQATNYTLSYQRVGSKGQYDVPQRGAFSALQKKIIFFAHKHRVKNKVSYNHSQKI